MIEYATEVIRVADKFIENQGGIIASGRTRLNDMEKHAEKINKMFGLNVVVSFTQDFCEAENENMAPAR